MRYSFNQILGHNQIIDHMKSAYTMQKVSHAYIIEGDEGMGKKTLVTTYVKLLQCENPSGDEPCHQCSSCIQIESNNHPDVIFVESTKKTGYGVDDIREQIIQDIHVKPYKSKYKIYVVEDADLMTQAAQNSLLKTIEEPPSYGMFFLLAQNSRKFLATILSRSIRMSLKPIDLYEIRNYLIQTYSVSDKQAKVYSSFSRGNVGKALELMNSTTFAQNRNDMIKLLDIFINHKEYDIMEAVKLLENGKEDVATLFEILISLIRDILYIKETGNREGIIHQDLEEQILRFSEKADAKRLIHFVYNANKHLSRLRLNINYSLSSLVMMTDVE